MVETTRPFDSLIEVKGKEVTVVMKNKQSITGTLVSFDIHLNVVLDNAREGENNLGKFLIRGDALETIQLGE